MKSWKKPTPEQVYQAVSLLVHVEQYRYFFDHLENPEWLEPLRQKGFLRHPPQPIRNEKEGTIRFPPWPEARYLARMAAYKPELVTDIIHEMDDTVNVVVLSDLVDALLAMPAEVGAELAEKTVRWAESPYWLLPEKMGQLLAHWAKGGRIDEALRVARVLLDILPGEGHTVPGPDHTYRLPPEPRARFDAWDYEEVLKDHYPDLVREAGLPALELLCELLEKAIWLSRRGGDDEGSKDYSYIWRPAVEDHPQNHGHTVKDALISGVRDAAELVIRSGRAIKEVVNALEEKHWKIFYRIALHLLRAFPEEAEEFAATKLTNRALFEDVVLRHEYVLLLRDRFRRLAPGDQAKILKWIENGPELDQWKQRRENATGRQPSEEEITRCEIWQRDWLARIGPENLPEEWREQYAGLVKKYGKPEHPEFSVYTESGWVGPTSPKTADELKAMSVSEIVEFLRTWNPPKSMKSIFDEPSPEGLGRVLSSVVAEDSGRFADEAPSFQELDPTYVRHVLFGLSDALGQGRAFGWEPVLGLCQWVVSQQRDIPGQQVRETDADSDWGWTRKAIADLLSAGFEDRQNGIPIDLRQRVWAILKPLTDDPDPTPEDEQRYGGSNMDPANLSINTTRGEAMHTVIRYALWVRRHLESEPYTEDRRAKWFGEMLEVREMLEDHLDLAREPSLAIRAVYGQWFPWLVLLDTDWARAHAARIFPQDRENEPFLEAAWNTYITLCWPYDNVLQILRPFYRFAVDRIGIRRVDTWDDPDQKLAEHLIVFYWRGKLTLNDSLFVRFWEKAPDAMKAYAIEFVGRSLARTEGEIPEEILDRLKQLWEKRLAITKTAQHHSVFEKELAAFGWWFVSKKFDTGWTIAQLSKSLRLARKVKPAHMVLEHLASTVHTHPQESIECLRMIAEDDRKGRHIYASRDNLREILSAALRHPTAADEARQVINYLGSRGFLEFRDLLEG